MSGIEFSNSKSIDYVLKSYSVFIQTDRAIYKPGNKVMFRCILLNSRLRPTLERLVDIYITVSIFKQIIYIKKHFWIYIISL